MSSGFRPPRPAARVVYVDRTAGGASPSAITTWDGGYYDGLREILTPVGGMLLAWNQYSSTAYLINPATRTRTTLPLRGIPRVQFTLGLQCRTWSSPGDPAVMERHGTPRQM